MGSIFEPKATEVQTSRTELPDWMLGPAKEAAQSVLEAGKTPFQPYGQNIYPYLSENVDFDDARNMIQKNTGIWRPYINAAEGTMQDVAGYTPETVSAGDVTAGLVKDADFDAYMNPYLQTVLQDSLAEMDRQAEIQRNQINANMAQGEAFGGARHGVVEAEQRRNEADLRNQTINRIYADAFQQALGMAQGDIDRTFAADQFNVANDLTADQFNVNSGLAGQQLNLSAASGMAGLGTTAAGLAASDAQQRLELARMREANERDRRTFEYQEFLRQIGYPFEAAGFLAGNLGRIPYPTTTYGEQLGPSPFGQIAGTAIAGIGAAGKAGLFA